jgi:serine/threonine protein kinase
MDGIHQDIKDSNIFVSKIQRRFVLGDLGLSSQLSMDGNAPFMGLTFGYASPEQVAKSRYITPASDVFSLCVTAINIMLQTDFSVNSVWMNHYPTIAKPRSLFPYRDGYSAEAFTAWKQFCGDDDVSEPLTQHEALPDQQRSFVMASYVQHYARIATVISALDEPLWAALFCGLNMNPSSRPQAKDLQAKMTLSQRDWARFDAVWDSMPAFSPQVADEIERLRPLTARAC